MADFTVRSDHIDVEQIMRQIRARIRDKRGADYTEAEIRELANVKLDKFLDPKAVRSDLLLHYRQQRRPNGDAPMPLYAFDPSIVYTSDRGTPGRILTFIRKLLNPILKLFFNPTPLLHVVHLQTQINDRVNTALVTREEFDALNFEMFNNLVVELTRLGIEVRNLRMQVESFGTRLDFDERRARALEGAVQYKPGAPVARPAPPAPPQQQPAAAGDEGGEEDEGVGAEGESGRSKRRRRRRGRRRGLGAAEGQGAEGQPGDGSSAAPAGDGRREPRESANVSERNQGQRPEGQAPRADVPTPREEPRPAPQTWQPVTPTPPQQTAVEPPAPPATRQASFEAPAPDEPPYEATFEPPVPAAEPPQATFDAPTRPERHDATYHPLPAVESSVPPAAAEPFEPHAGSYVERYVPEPTPVEAPVVPQAPPAPQATEPVRQFTRIYEREEPAPAVPTDVAAHGHEPASPETDKPASPEPAGDSGSGRADSGSDDPESSRS